MRLADLVRVAVERGPNTISREDVQRKIVVQANVAGRDLGSTVDEIRERVRLAVLVMANLPLALIGGIVAVALTDRVVSIASLVGFVTLFGIATRNGVLLVAHYQRLGSEGVPFRETVVRGLLERLAPILMTALAAGLALIPLALGAGEPGKEIQSPLALVVLGGLLSATALNMVVLPALYWLFGQRGAEAVRTNV